MFDAREYDAVVSSGEQVTAGLMALTLQEMDVPARSWQGWQVPLKTTSAHGAARIVDIPTDNLTAKFNDGMKVAVVAGFQGIGDDGRVTTLGRGGSDTTAVAFAAAFGADRCDIYTDVDGVYTTDPRIVRKGAQAGSYCVRGNAGTRQPGCESIADKKCRAGNALQGKVKSSVSFEDNDENAGTLVCAEEDIVESNVVAGVAYSRDEAKVTLISVADRPGIAAAIFRTAVRGGRKRRHDRAEHLGRRAHRHDVLLPRG